MSGPVSAGCEATDYVTASLSFGQWTGAQDDSPRALFLGPLNLADQKRKPFLAFYCANSISCSQPNTPLRRHLPQNVGYNHLPTGTSFDTYDSLVFNTLTLNAHFLGNARNRYAFWPRNDLDEPLSTGFSTGSVDKPLGHLLRQRHRHHRNEQVHRRSTETKRHSSAEAPWPR